MDLQFELRALRPDKIGMIVTGDRKEVVLHAKLAATRLPEAILLKKCKYNLVNLLITGVLSKGDSGAVSMSIHLQS